MAKSASTDGGPVTAVGVTITTMRVGALADRVGQRRVLTVALVIGAVTCAQRTAGPAEQLSPEPAAPGSSGGRG